MPLNSLQFALFFIIVILLYVLLKHKWQNRMLLAASCIFYAAWDWRFLLLIGISITTDYFCGLKIHASENDKVKKRFLILSILVNLAILGFFKYFNFFAANFSAFLGFLGLTINPIVLHIVLPLGISFYTFRTLSYTFDVYNGKIEPTRNYTDYALFVSFFPLIIAGPIVKAGDLLPQITLPRKLRLDWFYEGCYLIFWGLFQKMFIADNLARIVDPIFNSGPPYEGIKVLIGLYAFAFQIYCDFSGYSDISRGIGRCLGFDIMFNFNLPYFATNAREFWNRWHISLSSWLRDYIYTPLAFTLRGWGNRSVIFALMVTFILCGFWHGAAWTFILWGAYQGILVTAYMMLKPVLEKIPYPSHAVTKKMWFFLRVILFFQLTCVGWLLFRAHSVMQVYAMLQGLVFNFHLTPFLWLKSACLKIAFFLWILVTVQLFQYWKNDLMFMFKSPFLMRMLFYFACFCLLVIFGIKEAQEFIYYQF